MRSQQLFCTDNYAFLKEKSCFIIDLDGVVYKGSQPILGADTAIQKFRDLGKRVVFLTNSSASSPQTILNKLASFNIICDFQELLTSGQAAVSYISQHKLDEGKGVFVIGTDELKEELVLQKLRLADPDDCGLVLIGLDPKFNYTEIAKALRAINRGVSFVACNRDTNFPAESGILKPGCGAMVGAIEGATGLKANFEIGKPSTIMLDMLLGKLQVKLSECLIIGDTLASDILMANKAGIPSVWVSETVDRVNKTASSPQPNLCVSGLDELSKAI